MGLPHENEIRGSGGRRLRRRAGMLACALAAAALLGPAASGAAAMGGGGASGEGSPSASPSHPNALAALIAALGAARAEKAVDAIGHGFVLMEAQKRIDATERKLAREEAEEPEP